MQETLLPKPKQRSTLYKLRKRVPVLTSHNTCHSLISLGYRTNPNNQISLKTWFHNWTTANWQSLALNLMKIMLSSSLKSRLSRNSSTNRWSTRSPASNSMLSKWVQLSNYYPFSSTTTKIRQKLKFNKFWCFLTLLHVDIAESCPRSQFAVRLFLSSKRYKTSVKKRNRKK